jgi:hypothetical protein
MEGEATGAPRKVLKKEREAERKLRQRKQSERLQEVREQSCREDDPNPSRLAPSEARDLNQTAKDWHTRVVTLSEVKGLKDRFFATLRMTVPNEYIVKCTNVMHSGLGKGGNFTK